MSTVQKKQESSGYPLAFFEMPHVQLRYVIDNARVSANCCQHLAVEDPSIHNRSEVALEVARLYHDFHKPVRIVAREHSPRVPYIISGAERSLTSYEGTYDDIVGLIPCSIGL
jgi:predicted RNA-binding protein